MTVSISTALLRPETYVAQVREAMVIARCAATYPLGLAAAMLTTGTPSGDSRRDTPVVLVHGYGHNRSGWFALERALRRSGFTSVHTMNYVAFGSEGVEKLAARLAAHVDRVRELTGCEKVHLVGHSLGGVLLRWYVHELGGAQAVDTAITVASPHEGTAAAHLGFGPAARDLRPGSRVMRRLAAAAARPTGVNWVALYSNVDLVVQPAASAKLRAPALRAENVLVDGYGHVGIMSSRVVVDAIVERLSLAGPMAKVLPFRQGVARRRAARPARRAS